MLEQMTIESSAASLCLLARTAAELPLPLPDTAMDEELARIERVLADLASGRREFMVVVMGEFSTGKSTLINALIGRPVARMASTIETGHISRFRYGQPERAVFHLRSGDDHTLPLVEVDRLLGSAEGRSDEFVTQVEWVDLFVDAAPLRTMSLVDTPGLGTVQALHEKITTAYIDKAEAVLWVFDANQAGTGTEVSYLQQLGGHRCVIGVLNKVDDLDEEDVPQVVAHVRSIAPGVLRDVLTVSAYEALAALHTDDLEALQTSGIPALAKHLEEHVFALQDVVAAATRNSQFQDTVQQLYVQVSRRRAHVAQLIGLDQRTDGLLRQRRAALVDRARDELAKANAEFISELKRQWRSLCSAQRPDLHVLAQQAEIVLGPEHGDEHRRALERKAKALFAEEWQNTTVQLEEQTRDFLAGRLMEGVVLADESTSDRLKVWLSSVGGGAVTGAVAGGIIAAVSATITIGILPFAIGLGAVGGLGGVVSHWVKSAQSTREGQAELNRQVVAALNEQRRDLDRFVDERVVPDLSAHTAEVEVELRRKFVEDVLCGCRVESIQGTGERLAAIERDLQRVARHHAIDFAGLVPVSADGGGAPGEEAAP